ncbi:MAG: alpha/beta fold hydrolase [Desulfuromonadales bacterium]|nr:alpha/beta fold hydrolase [Desulfuromonadales bacterium]
MGASRKIVRCLLLVLSVASLSGCLPERLLFSTPPFIPSERPFAEWPREEVLFRAGDLQLHGWQRPAALEGPLILYFHGTGTHLAREVAGLLELQQQLALPVFAFDYRGFGASQGRPSVDGLFADARAALAFVEASGWRRDQVIYYGHSLGAAVALQLALEAPPAALVLESPFTSLFDLISWHYPGASPWIAWLFPDYYNNLEKIKRLQTPLLLIHGADDRQVPALMAGRLFTRAPGPKSLLLLAGGDHAAPRQADAATYWEAWRQFLSRCCSQTRLIAAPHIPME